MSDSHYMEIGEGEGEKAVVVQSKRKGLTIEDVADRLAFAERRLCFLICCASILIMILTGRVLEKATADVTPRYNAYC